MNQELVSIIIPVYNVEPYIRQSLDSVINQTYNNIEVIIVNDDSTDRSGEICEEYLCDPRVKLIHQKHSGVSVTRNAGLDMSTGAYIAFLDPDDIYHPDYIRIMLSTILKEKTDIVVCGYKVCKTAKTIQIDKYPTVNPLLKSGLYNRNQACGALADGDITYTVWNKLYNRNLWKNIRFPEGFDIAEDCIAIYRLFSICSSLYLIDQTLYYYRIRLGSLTTIYLDKNISDGYYNHSAVRKFIKLHIPELFSEHQLHRVQQIDLRRLMRQLGQVNDKMLFIKLRRWILKLGKEIGIRNCNIEIRVVYYMIYLYPSFFRRLYWVYSQIKLLIRSMTSMAGNWIRR